jgi:hypothetical protein
VSGNFLKQFFFLRWLYKLFDKALVEYCFAGLWQYACKYTGYFMALMLLI